MTQPARRDRMPWTAALAALAFAAIGAAALAWTHAALRSANSELAAARRDRAQADERFARGAVEAREIAAGEEMYRRLLERKIVGAERRLEWSEALARIRERRNLRDLRYQIAPRRMLRSVAGEPGTIAIHASTLKIELGLLHEGDLLGLLGDLRRSGYAHPAVTRCAIARNPQPGDATAPRLRANCEIELITLEDGGSRT